MVYDTFGIPHPSMGDGVSAWGLAHIATCDLCRQWLRIPDAAVQEEQVPEP